MQFATNASQHPLEFAHLSPLIIFGPFEFNTSSHIFANSVVDLNLQTTTTTTTTYLEPRAKRICYPLSNRLGLVWLVLTIRKMIYHPSDSNQSQLSSLLGIRHEWMETSQLASQSRRLVSGPNQSASLRQRSSRGRQMVSNVSTAVRGFKLRTKRAILSTRAIQSHIIARKLVRQTGRYRLAVT